MFGANSLNMTVLTGENTISISYVAFCQYEPHRPLLIKEAQNRTVGLLGNTKSIQFYEPINPNKITSGEFTKGIQTQPHVEISEKSSGAGPVRID
jgi:hypothetical protein